MDPLVDPKRDPVSELLGTVRVRSSIFCRSELLAPWGWVVGSQDNPTYHVVVEGRCWLQVEGVEGQMAVAAGECAVLTTGARHWLRDRPETAAIDIENVLRQSPIDRYAHMSYGGGGTRTTLLCGTFSLEGATSQALLRNLPPVIHIRTQGARPVPWITGTLDLIAAEVESDAPGATEVISRLADALLTQVLRGALHELQTEDPGRLGALRDPVIAKAIELLHRHPERAWTTGQLAAELALSRSAFASRFREVVGESPRRYSSRTRLALAARLLRRTDGTLAEIAERTGYENEFSFSKAFRRAFGIAPGAYRRTPPAPDIMSADRPLGGGVPV
jgi:AraC-like DNA-binding protein